MTPTPQKGFPSGESKCAPWFAVEMSTNPVPVTRNTYNVLVVACEQGRGTLSGATVSKGIYSVFSFRDGKITRYEEFLDWRAARDAAGLSG